MRGRIARWWLVFVTVMLLIPAAPVAAQTPGAGPGNGQGPGPGPGSGPGQGPGPFHGVVPPGGGVALMVMDQDQDRDQLLLHLRLQDCEPRVLAVTSGGGWRMFIPGLPAWVNGDFPGRLLTGEPLLVDCARDGPTVRLTDGDNGKAVTLQTGNRLRVVLESNASTGHSWVVTPTPSAAVLAAIGEPFYVPPASTLLGAAGHQVFDFRAVAAGATTLHLAYQRATTPAEPPIAEWSVAITVQP